MKNTNIRKLKISVLIGLLFFGFQIQSKAQADVATLMKAGVVDANELIDAYISPFGNSFGTTMNSGWFNTARYLKPGGFDINISLNAVMVPTSAKTFDFVDLSTISLKLVNPGAGSEGPTIFGEASDGPEVGIKVPNPLSGLPGQPADTFLTTFKTPPGTGLGFFGLPSAQFRIGTVKNTDLIIRFMPTLKIPGDKISGEVSLWGIAVKHDFKQWIPGIKNKPFDLAALVSYSKFSFDIGFPGQLVNEPGSIYSDGSTPVASTYDDQGFTYDVSAFSINAIISKQLSVLTLYGALGLNSSKADMKLVGHYPVITELNANMSGGIDYINTDFADPIDISTSMTTPKVTAGFRLKLAIFTIHADYSYSKYPYVSAGIGFIFREAKMDKIELSED